MLPPGDFSKFITGGFQVLRSVASPTAEAKHVFSGCDCGPLVVLKPCGVNSEPPAERQDQGPSGPSVFPAHARLSLCLSLPQSISAMKVVEFQGVKHKASSPISLPPVKRLDLTPSPDVPLAILKRRLMSTNDLQESRHLAEDIRRHLEVGGGERAAPGLTKQLARAPSLPPDHCPALLGAR